MANIVKKKTIQEQTAAESKSIGFDYQYYYFLFLMLQLESDQAVGYEAKDDVHIDKPDGKQIFFQLKHSIETKSDGTIVNLTEKDEDIWKTISNWVKIINDEVENRTTLDMQIEFINKTDFHLITNKSESKENEFLEKITFFQKSQITVQQIKDYLLTISTPAPGKSSSMVDTYIMLLIKQKPSWLKAFFSKIIVEHNKDDLIANIKVKIKEKNVKDTRIDDVFSSVDSHLRRIMYDDIKARKKIVITFEDYYRNFTRYFELGRNKKLPIRLEKKKVSIPVNAQTHISIRQLIDTEILSEVDEDFDEIVVNIFTSKYELNNNLIKWIQDSDITEDDKKAFDKESFDRWAVIFKSVYSKILRKLRTTTIDTIDQEELIELASTCYYKTLELQLTIDETELTTNMSNGQFYLLSDKPTLGWHFNWKERYKP